MDDKQRLREIASGICDRNDEAIKKMDGEQGRVLSEEEIKAIEGYANYYGGTEESDALLDSHYRNELRLIATVRHFQSQCEKYVEVMDAFEHAKQEIRDRDKTISALEHYAHDIKIQKTYRALFEREKQQNTIMREALEQFGEWAQNDINMRTRQGQWVGSPKFASLQTAKEVKKIVEALTKVSDQGR